MAILHFLAAGVRIDLDCPDTATADLITAVGGPLLLPGGDPADRAPDGASSEVIGEAAVTRLDARSVVMPPGASLSQRAGLILGAVERTALRLTPFLPIHAAALAGPSGAVVIPGASGAGKSTLTAAGMQAGMTLLSDEAACFAEPTGTLLPLARPLGLSLESRRLLGVSDAADSHHEFRLAPTIFGAVAPPNSRHTCVLVVVPRWATGASTSLEPTSRLAGLNELLAYRLDRGDGQATWPNRAAWEYLSHLVSKVEVATLRYDHPREGADALRRALT